eukprot:CAMPEP_0179205602 /NCGR_PEP_ID=MMETSP0796-20121207/102502_1 /TAXON_ID=73915 /ORGANISM="Pyrodinium bahamense, Strain pbaha01" /LENGTH=149 /DNA_ID=CAMNT_0020910493 /DNA_START=22 /DNA_END=469 /DNA_ORIENTATION=+
MTPSTPVPSSPPSMTQHAAHASHVGVIRVDIAQRGATVHHEGALTERRTPLTCKSAPRDPQAKISDMSFLWMAVKAARGYRTAAVGATLRRRGSADCSLDLSFDGNMMHARLEGHARGAEAHGRAVGGPGDAEGPRHRREVGERARPAG